jgi:precorrin isomerase
MVLIHYSGDFRFVKLLYLGAKAVGTEALSTGSNILTDMLNKDPEQPVSTIIKKRFSEAKGNLQQKIKKMTGSDLTLKRKRKYKTVQSLGKRRKVKDISTNTQ